MPLLKKSPKFKMRNCLTLLSIVTLVVSSFNLDEENPYSVLKRVKENYDNHTSISYKMIYRRKSFSRDDTLRWDAACKLVRDKNDTVFGGRIWFLTSDSFERYYDLNNLYLVDHKGKKITEFKAHLGQTGPITGNAAGDVIKVNFQNTSKLLMSIGDSLNKTSMISNPDYYIVSILYPEIEKFTERKLMVWVKKNENIIERITYQAKYQGNYQYNEWNLSRIEFDNVSVEKLDNSLFSFNKLYESEQYIPLSEKDYITLSNGTSAPLLKGINSQTGKRFSLDAYIGNFVILDFSYMSCMPCVKAIPHLVKIQREHKGLHVFAINSNDNNENGRKRIPNFIKFNEINYDMILTSRASDSIYNVKAYPTLYAIDKYGKVVYSQVGFSDALTDSLEKIIGKYHK